MLYKIFYFLALFTYLSLRGIFHSTEKKEKKKQITKVHHSVIKHLQKQSLYFVLKTDDDDDDPWTAGSVRSTTT